MGKKLMLLAALCALWPGWLMHAKAAEVPAVSAASAVLLDAASGRVLFAQNENESRPIASITKLMTALVAVEHLEDLEEPVTIRPEWTGIEGTSLYLTAGEVLTVRTLLYGLLLQSGNDAAVALAAHCAGEVETFVGWMNRKAADLGMTGTHFSDPNGLGDENHYSTALDMARLGQACLEEPVLAEIMATRSITLEGRNFTNHNKLLWQYPGCTGMKTGYTRQAGRTLVSSARRGEQTLLCVTLCDGNDWADHKALLDYGFETYPLRVLTEEGEILRRLPLKGSLLRQIPVAARTKVVYPVREGELVKARVELPKTARAPLARGEQAGLLTFYLGEAPIGTTELVWGKTARQDVLSASSAHSPLGFLKQFAEGKEKA